MRAQYYWNNKRITKKEAEETFGADVIRRVTAEAWNGHMHDPMEVQSIFIHNGVLRVDFVGY